MPANRALSVIPVFQFGSVYIALYMDFSVSMVEEYGYN